MTEHPHEGQPLVTAGVPLSDADVAIILFHGRGADPSSMQALAEKLDLSRTAVLMPTAAGGRWYPKSFLEPPEENEPDLSSALAVATSLVERCASAGIAPDHIILGGFSQGACLASEWVARNANKYGGLVVLSGGLIGPIGELPRHRGSLAGTPVLIGCSDIDPWIPFERFEETVEELQRLGATVDALVFKGADHSVRPGEIAAFDAMLQNLKGTE